MKTNEELRSEIRRLRRLYDTFRRKATSHALEAHNATVRLNAMCGTAQSLEVELRTVKHKLFVVETKSKAREQGLKGALDMLRKSNDVEWDGMVDDEHVMLSKKSVADFLLLLNRIEDPP